MKKISEMSINELRDLLSQITDPSSAGPAQAMLESKTLMYLSNEIAVFKEALCSESKAISENTKVVSTKLVEIVQAVGATSEKLHGIVQVAGSISKDLKIASENAEKISRVQIGQTYAMIGWTAALFLATLGMAIVGYFQMQEAQKLTNVAQEQVKLQRNNYLLEHRSYLGVDIDKISFPIDGKMHFVMSVYNDSNYIAKNLHPSFNFHAENILSTPVITPVTGSMVVFPHSTKILTHDLEPNKAMPEFINEIKNGKTDLYFDVILEYDGDVEKNLKTIVNFECFGGSNNTCNILNVNVFPSNTQ